MKTTTHHTGDTMTKATQSQKAGFASFQDRLAAALRTDAVKDAAKGEWKKGLETRAQKAERIAADLRSDR